MGNLINSIPVYNPQRQQKPALNTNSPVSTPVVKPDFDFKNPYPQTQVYTYLPARPLSPGTTAPQGIKAQASTARLVKENFLQSVGSTVTSYVDYAKYFYNAAFKGEGDDYKVGKINDLSIRAGSLGIAAVLASSKMFPFAKGMEFVGLGTWFASMAIWPLILGAPIKAKTGVDINQEYIDSYGRRKYVYEDNQYRPMDLYRHVDIDGTPLSEEDYHKKYATDYVYLEKIGDKLGIPRDIKNRNEATMNKMGQVAVQGKTLWMLTAGVMTPVVSSIVADACQQPLKNYLEKTRYEKASQNLNKLVQQIDKVNNSGQKELSKVMEGLNIKIDPKVQSKFEELLTDKEALSPEEFKKLQKFLDKMFFGTGFHESMKTAMMDGVNLTEPKLAINEAFKQNIKNITSDAFKEVIARLPEEAKAKLPQQILAYNGMTDAQIREMLVNTWSEGKSQIGFNAIESLRNSVGKDALEPFLNINTEDKQFLRQFNNTVRKVINEKVDAYIESSRYFVIPKDKMTQIFKFAYTNNTLQNRLKEFEVTSIKNISESMTAINWEKVPKKYIKALGLTDAEMAVMATQDTSKASQVLMNKFTQIAQNPDKFKAVLKEMSKYAQEAISKEEKAVIQLIGQADKQGALHKIKYLMEDTARANFGENVKNILTVHYDARIKEIQRKYRNTVDSYVKPIKVLDLYKNIKHTVKSILCDNEEAYKNMIREDMASHRNAYYPFHKMSYEQAKKSLEAYIKDAILQKNDINNWTTKFETELLGGKRGMKYSLTLVQKMANAMFDDLSADTVAALAGDLPEKASAQEIERFDALKRKAAAFAEKINLNNSVMRSRFLRIENELTIEYPSHNNYMTTRQWFTGLINEFFEGKTENYKKLLGILEDRRSNLSAKQYQDCMTILNNVRNNMYKDASSRQCLINCLDGWSSNRAIAQMTGKNVTDFFVSAAQEIRSRNKWTKLVYGLLSGTLALSAITIAFMGKKNYFNKDKYEKIDGAPQEAGK